MQERELAIPEGKDVECLLDELKAHFGSTVSAAASAAQRKALLAQLGDKAASVDERMLEMASNMQMVGVAGRLLGNAAWPGLCARFRKMVVGVRRECGPSLSRAPTHRLAPNPQVENISLLANHRDAGYVGVNMYCDDMAGGWVVVGGSTGSTTGHTGQGAVPAWSAQECRAMMLPHLASWQPAPGGLEPLHLMIQPGTQWRKDADTLPNLS